MAPPLAVSGGWLQRSSAEEGMGGRWRTDVMAVARKRFADAAVEVPSQRVESYRFTPLKGLWAADLGVSGAVGESALGGSPAEVEAALKALTPEEVGWRVVLCNGRVDSAASLLEGLPEGVFVGGWEDASAEIAERALELAVGGRLTGPASDDFFAVLNAAMGVDCLVLHVPSGVKVEKPIHLVVHDVAPAASPATGPVASPRIVVMLDAGAEATILQHHVSVPAGAPAASFNNGCVSVAVGEDAFLYHHLINELPAVPPPAPQHLLIQSLDVDIAARANYDFVSISTGGNLSRLTAEVNIRGEKAHAAVRGAYVADKTAVADLHSTIVHHIGNSTSEQIQKNVAGGRGSVVFGGKIVVMQGADGTDAKQLSRSLLLSNRAEVNAMPALEIFTDDVSCTHGATVSDISEEELFYLQSRGLTQDVARILLISAFVAEVNRHLPYTSLRDRFSQAVASIEYDVKLPEYSVYSSV